MTHYLNSPLTHGTYQIDDKCIQFWSESLEGNRPFRKTRCRWEKSTNMDLEETGHKDVKWMQLAQGRV